MTRTNARKSVDAVGLMRQIRDRLSKQFADMTFEEQSRYIDERLNGVKQAASSARRTTRR